MSTEHNSLLEYMAEHTQRGACMCGECTDARKDADKHQPLGHTSNVEFFKVTLVDEPDADTLKHLIKVHKGEFLDVDVFDGAEHNFLDIGAWIGDQSAGLCLMGMGELLGLWALLTPTSMGMPEDTRMYMAQNGMVSIKAIQTQVKS